MSNTLIRKENTLNPKRKYEVKKKKLGKKKDKLRQSKGRHPNQIDTPPLTSQKHKTSIYR